MNQAILTVVTKLGSPCIMHHVVSSWIVIYYSVCLPGKSSLYVNKLSPTSTNTYLLIFVSLWGYIVSLQFIIHFPQIWPPTLTLTMTLWIYHEGQQEWPHSLMMFSFWRCEDRITQIHWSTCFTLTSNCIWLDKHTVSVFTQNTHGPACAGSGHPLPSRNSVSCHLIVLHRLSHISVTNKIFVFK